MIKYLTVTSIYVEEKENEEVEVENAIVAAVTETKPIEIEIPEVVTAITSTSEVNSEMQIEMAKMIASGIATVSLAGSGVGVGVVFGSLLMAFGRNPFLKNQLFQYAVLGFALTEAVGLLGLMMSFLLLFG